MHPAEVHYFLIDKVFEILILKIHQYEGVVNELRGDGVLALFGAPVALEDDTHGVMLRRCFTVDDHIEQNKIR